MFDCVNCNKSFSSKEGLGGHRRVHGKPTSNCKYCGTQFTYRKSHSLGMFCDNQCQAKFKWFNVTLERILLGKASHNTLRKFKIKSHPYCSECDQGEIWNMKPISLHLDHIDGNSDNNTLINTRLLCPNCHSQTNNFGVKNKGQDSRRNRNMKSHRNK